MRLSTPRLGFGLLVAGLVALALVPTGSAKMPLDQHRFLGSPVQIENLTVWPIHSSAPIATGALLSLAEAQKKGVVTVREKTSSAVNELIVENTGDQPILVPAGTILKGGKQDRQVGDDIVIEAKTAAPVPAFCIERGRWSGNREGAETEGIFEVSDLLAAKRIRSSAQYGKSQTHVWNQVDRVNRKAEKDPSTGTFLATVEEDDEAALALRKRMSQAVLGHFEARRQADPAVVGFAYAINGEPITVRAFANPSLLAAHLDPFVQTMSLEAQVAQARDREAGRDVFGEPAPAARVIDMVRAIDRASPEVRDTNGLNRNRLRVNERGGSSASLVLMGNGETKEWVAVTEDWTAAAEVTGELVSELGGLRALGYTRD